jgi:hypothetical protein
LIDPWDSEPVEVPGLVLTAGTYWFTLADSDSDRNIIQIWDVGRMHLITTILAIPDYRLQPTGKTVIHFEERPGSHSFVVLPRRQLRRGGCLSENQGGAVRQTNQPASAVNAG